MQALTKAPTRLRESVFAVASRPRISRFAEKYGWRLAKRFVAGQTLDDCVSTIKELAALHMRAYAIELGENVESRSDVERVVAGQEVIIERLAEADLGTTIAVKLTHLGLTFDEDLAHRNAARILDSAAKAGMFARIDMEHSACVDSTLRIYERLRADGFENVGIALQAYLYRTEADVKRLLPLGANVRLVKGAYLEPKNVAFPRKRQVDANFVRLLDVLLGEAEYVAIATHDEAMIRYALSRINRVKLPTDGFEFQMLLGVRPERQRSIAAEGRPMRVCVPFGSDWYPYLVRRMAERPANLIFGVRSLYRS